MIVLSGDATRSATQMLALEGAQVLSELETWTGADLLLSTHDDTPLERHGHLMWHLEHGALLVQIKFGSDLASSLGIRLNESLARMCAVTSRQAQRVFLFVGTLTADGSGNAVIDGKDTYGGTTYAACAAAMSKWCDRGGVTDRIPTESYLAGWVKMRLAHLAEYERAPIKRVYPLREDVYAESDDPLQALEIVDDLRSVLVNMRVGIGLVMVQDIWEVCGGDALQVIDYLTDRGTPGLPGRPRGLTIRIIDSVRAKFGVPNDWRSLLSETKEKL